MRIEGRQAVPLSRSEAWRRLNDPSVILRCAPGLESLEEVGVLEGHQGWVNSVVVSEKHIVTASVDKTVIIWDPGDLQQIRVLSAHDHWVNVLLL